MSNVVKERIIEIRNAIRAHRDALGDDRCWLDDFNIWKYLPDPPKAKNMSPADGMIRCEKFYTLRRVRIIKPNSPDAILDPVLWDSDLWEPDRYLPSEMDRKLQSLLQALRVHHQQTLLGPIRM